MFCPAGPGPGPACPRSRMFDYVYTDHAQYTIKMYAKMALFRLASSNWPALCTTEFDRSDVPDGTVLISSYRY